MLNSKKYAAEYTLLLFVLLLSLGGFWNIYFGANAAATPYQHLHVVTSLIWLLLLLYQLTLIGKKQLAAHRRTGLSILFVGPLLVATTALLSVHSAHKGMVSGEGDMLIVQNVMATIELAIVLLLAFAFQKRKKLHGSFLLSTAVIFMGIALFFTLISFVPGYKIEGPETFHRFTKAAATGRYVCLLTGLFFFLKDRRNGWPVLLVASFFSLNEFINSLLIRNNLIGPLTEFVGSLNQYLTFFGTFILLLVLLSFTGLSKRITALPVFVRR